MTTLERRSSGERLLSPKYALTTCATFGLMLFVAFEAVAVATVMPTVARDLQGLHLFALAFAAPLASGVVGMVAAGMWSDRTGPTVPLLTALALFSLGLLVCGVAPSMEILLIGRVLQGLGGGALTVVLFIVVGLVYPPLLQPAIFASFAAAWVLPALFGPALAAFVTHQWSWRWVFLAVIALVILALALLIPALRAMRPTSESTATPTSRLWWAIAGAAGVLLLELAGSARGPLAATAAAPLVAVIVALRRLLPAGTLIGRPGLPAVIATRGLLSAVFFVAEAYIVYVLQDHWHLTPGQAGMALTVVGVVWAVGSQAQSSLGSRVCHARVIQVGMLIVLVGVSALALSVAVFDAGTAMSAAVPAACYVVAGGGMGFAYPRTGVAMLESSTDADRGFNSSALAIADSLGAALALSLAGVAYALAQTGPLDPFLVVFTVAALDGVLGVLVATRTRDPFRQ